QLIVLGLVGLIAQLIDGSLGMAYGVTSTTLLLAAGTAPAAASAAVHFSELGTTLVSGISPHKFGNVDWRTGGLLAGPGVIAAPSLGRGDATRCPFGGRALPRTGNGSGLRPRPPQVRQRGLAHGRDPRGPGIHRRADRLDRSGQSQR